MSSGAPLAEGGESNFKAKIHMPRFGASNYAARRATTALVVVAGAVGVGVGMLYTSLFAVERIDVRGNGHLSRDQVLSIAGIKNGMPLISVSEGTAAGKLKATPWVFSAKIERHWPHVVTVSVAERRPIAMAQTAAGKWAELGDGGIVLAVSDQAIPGLPLVLDLQSPATPGATVGPAAVDLMTVAQEMPISLQPRVTQMQRTDQGEIRLGLGAGTVVELGDMRQMPDKLMAAAAVFSHTDPKTLATLDVRSPHLPLATPKVAATAPAVAEKSSTASTVKPSTAKSTTTTTKKSTTSTTTAPKTTKTSQTSVVSSKPR